MSATIVCGTDFTKSAAAAATVASAFARRMAARLALVHVREPLAFREILEREDVRVAEAVEREAARLRETGITVESQVLVGISDEELVAFARRIEAEALVLGALGHRSPAQWLLGSTADRSVQTATTPVLVARAAGVFVEWSQGRRQLRVLAGVEPSHASAAALRWADDFRRRGLCELVVAHVRDRKEAKAGAKLEAWAASAEAPLGDQTLRVVERARHEHVSDRLLRLAQEERADLLVVGIHRRGPIDRLRHGSVLRSVAHGAPLTVLCVPVEDAMLGTTDAAAISTTKGDGS